MLAYHICLLFCLLSIVCGQEKNETQFERIDAFHALGKCSHQSCERENKAFTSTIEKTSALHQRIERCSKCRIKKYEELNGEEKRKLLNCIKENDCETGEKFHEEYKQTDEFKKLNKCLESKCSEEYKMVMKYKDLNTAPENSLTSSAPELPKIENEKAKLNEND